MDLKQMYEKKASFGAMRQQKKTLAESLQEKIKMATDDDLEILKQQAEKLADEIENLIGAEENLDEEIKSIESDLNKVASASSISRKNEKKSSSEDYLKSKEAVEDFASILIKTEASSAKEIHKAWQDHVRTKGINDIEAILPTPIINAIVDAFEDEDRVYGSFIKRSGFTTWSTALNDVAGENNARAQGWDSASGGNKIDQPMDLKPKEIICDYTYKYITIPKKIYREAQGSLAAVLTYIMDELPRRIVSEIERTAVIGGNASEFEPMINASDDYTITQAGTASLFDDIAIAAATILTDGMKYAVVDSIAFAKMRIEKDTTGALKYPLGTDFAAVLGVDQVFTPKWFSAQTAVQAVVYAGDSYVVIGDQTIENYENFILAKNSQEYLAELYQGGALMQPNSCVKVTTYVP